MSDLLTAASNIRGFLATLDGLRTLAPVLERIGSLEQACEERCKTQETEIAKIAALKAEAAKLQTEHDLRKTQVEVIVQDAVAQRDEIISTANEQAQRILIEAKISSDTLIDTTKAAIESLKADSVELSKALVEKGRLLNEEIATGEAKLANIRAAIAEIAGR